MNLWDKFSLNFKYLNVFILVMIFGFSINPQITNAEISPDAYCQLTIAEMQQQISDYQELIALANQYKDALETLAQQEAIKRAQFDQEKEARYSSFGTTAEEYVLYMGKNENAVNIFLEANPDIKQQIDDLSDQIKALAEEHEAIKETINQLSAPPPLP